MPQKLCEVCGGYCIDDDTCYWSVLIGRSYDWRNWHNREVTPVEPDQDTA